MATPANLSDFAHGFALTEGIISDLAQIEDFKIVHHEQGLEARFLLSEDRADVLMARRRAMTGISVLIAVSDPTGAAVHLAQQAGITLAAFARAGGFDLYSHPHRITDATEDVA